DSTPVSALKQSMLATIQFPLSGAGSSCTVTPTAPTALSASATSASQVNISWTASAPPAGCTITYSVFRGTSSNFTPSSSNQIATGLTATAFADSGLNASTTYYYAVEAADAAGSSGPSNVASATTQPGVSQCTTVPATPAGLNPTAAPSSQIKPAWSARPP